MKNGFMKVAVVACSFLAGQAAAQTADNGGTTGTDAQWEATKHLSQPTKNHSWLVTSMIGQWTTTTNFWPAPNAETVTSTGTTTMTAAMGGRFVKQEFSCLMNGEQFRGTGFFGFNNATNTLESFWVDSLSTGMLMSTGARQGDGSVVWTGTYTDENGNAQTSKSVTRFPSPDTIVFECYENATDGTEFKCMEVTYTRTATVVPTQPTVIPGNAGKTTATGNFTNTTNTTKTPGTALVNTNFANATTISPDGLSWTDNFGRVHTKYPPYGRNCWAQINATNTTTTTTTNTTTDASQTTEQIGQ